MSRDYDIPFIENVEDLGLDINKLTFKRVNNINRTEVVNTLVRDLVVDNVHNYHTTSGIVHNGGGL
jgi:hypothetical protein